ncbi:MAG: aminomethyl-transferring glycine dehydrogenase subunit GcvPB [Sedimentibacter sp.]|uniref:aminomethyl-transferring glycine dehydrogenase subunit GcvPB n=1 Tax=Sedimentibacter sp. TaxID=1960295 RepID=UPI0031587EA1
MKEDMKVRNFHQARWNEPIIFELSTQGQRGILIPEPEKELREQVGEFENLIPKSIERKRKAALPEIAQPQVLRHFLRLSQETLGQDINIDIGLGTCTMKYSPKINEQFVSNHKFSELHPLQDDETTQGILEIIYKTEEMLKEISGMDSFSFQPGGGAQAVFSNASILKAYHSDRGEVEQRDEIITTLLSHPVNAAAPRTKGFKVITLMPDKETGYADIETLKSVVSNRTAGMFITNPEDTGIYNPIVKEMIKIVHDAGGLCIADQADANGLFGITRAREAGYDMCHFNLHKAFSSPHGSMGPCCGAQGVRDYLVKYLPSPVVKFDGKRYGLDNDRPESIGKIREFYGVIAVVLRAYAWILSIGAERLKEVSEISVINNNYMMKKLLKEVKGISVPWAEGQFRMEQIRYSWEKLKNDTGVNTEDIDRRSGDYGLQGYFQSHHPRIIKEPFTPEPNESYSKKEIDEYVNIFKKISEEAYENPEIVKTSPHNGPISLIPKEEITDPDDLIVTWRVYKRKKKLDVFDRLLK